MQGNHVKSNFGTGDSKLGPGSYRISSLFKSKAEYTVPRLHFGSSDRSFVCC